MREQKVNLRPLREIFFIEAVERIDQDWDLRFLAIAYVRYSLSKSMILVRNSNKQKFAEYLADKPQHGTIAENSNVDHLQNGETFKL